MGFKNSPPFVQRTVDRALQPLRDSTEAYTDDIVAFSKNFEKRRPLEAALQSAHKMDITHMSSRLCQKVDSNIKLGRTVGFGVQRKI